MIIFSTLKTFLKKFCTWSGHRSISVTRDDAECYKIVSTNLAFTQLHNMHLVNKT